MRLIAAALGAGHGGAAAATTIDDAGGATRSPEDGERSGWRSCFRARRPTRATTPTASGPPTPSRRARRRGHRHRDRYRCPTRPTSTASTPATGYDLVIGWGGQFTDGALAAAEEFPDVNFLVVNCGASRTAPTWRPRCRTRMRTGSSSPGYALARALSERERSAGSAVAVLPGHGGSPQRHRAGRAGRQPGHRHHCHLHGRLRGPDQGPAGGRRR